MGYADLIEAMEKLSPARQAEVIDFAMFLATRCDDESASEAQANKAARKAMVIAAMQNARASFPKQDPETLRKEFADMRNEWESR